MDIDSLKEEYCKSEVTFKDICIKIDKIPAFRAASLFTSLMKHLFDDIKDIDLNDTENSTRNLLISAISGLDEQYLEKTIQPSLFKYMSFKSKSGNPYKTYLNLWDNKQLVEPFVSFDEVFELIIRGVCVNFLQSLLERFQKLQMNKSLIIEK